MNNMNNSNPFFNTARFSNAIYSGVQSGTMTVQSTVRKILFLMMLVFIAAGASWMLTANGYQQTANVLMLVGLIVGFLTAMVISFKPDYARAGSIVYALCEGFVLGGITVIAETKFPGIALITLGLTFGTLSAMLLLYLFDLIRVNDTMRTVITTATVGIALTYGIALIFRLFGMNMSFMYGSGTGSIIFSLIVVGVAAFNLVLDFDLIERGAEAELPKHMEWYCSFAVLVTMVWLYLEILRLAMKLRERR